MKNTNFFFLVLAIIAMVFIAGCAMREAPAPASTPQPTIITIAGSIGTRGSPFGTILVDSRGKTLYYFADDIPGSGTSACTGQCAALWPAISADTKKVSSPLIPADFGSITRADGSAQTTYHGRPLYYYQQDSIPGDLKGENMQNLWFVARPGERVQVAHRGDLGVFLTDSSGKTLYYFTRDTAGASTCTDNCIVRWPAFSAEPVTAPSLMKPADFSAITRADGIKQIAYRGKPLYSYAGDAKPGEVNGQGIGGTWYVATVSGATPVATAAKLTTLRTAAPTQASSKTYIFEGSGDKTQKFTTTADVMWLFDMTYSGEEIFMVVLKNETGDNIGVLAETGGSYTGAISERLKPGTYYLDVSAAGPWKITLISR
jgi:predicted lipoprotein with Yx(FWY)xxD motif